MSREMVAKAVGLLVRDGTAARAGGRTSCGEKIQIAGRAVGCS